MKADATAATIIAISWLVLLLLLRLVLAGSSGLGLCSLCRKSSSLSMLCSSALISSALSGSTGNNDGSERSVGSLSGDNDCALLVLNAKSDGSSSSRKSLMSFILVSWSGRDLVVLSIVRADIYSSVLMRS